jgi:PhnB protein
MTTHEIFPYLCVKNASEAIAFYVKAFGAKEKFRLVEPSGRVGHAEIELGPHVVMLSEEYPEFGIRAPVPGTSLPFCVHIHVDDADVVMKRAVDAGGTIVRPLSDAFYGERGGRLRDPFGHEWLIGHHIEDVSPAEMQRRYTALFAGS